MRRYKQHLIYATIILLVTLIEIPGILNFEIMTPVYSVPYFSGSVNTGVFEQEWHYNPSLADTLKEKNYWEQLIYHFKADENKSTLPSYTGYNNKGFLYLIKFDSALFPFVGQMGAVVIMNLILHILISVYSIRRFKTSRFRLLFTILYCINPLVLFVVITPYYYFIQVIPAFIFIYILTKPEISKYAKLIIYLATLMLFFIRPTTILINALNIFLLHKSSRIHIRILLGTAYLVVMFLLSAMNKHLMLNQPWHTAVAGIGVYPSKCIDAYPGDNFVFETYAQITGDSVDGSLGGKLYDSEYRKNYYNTLRIYYFDFIKDCPQTAIRNGSLNVLQSFGAGYRVDNLALNYMSAFLGFCVILFLLIQKRYLPILAIGLSTITFTVYHPPIVTYMFGSYLLIMFTVISAFYDYGRSKT